jgi:GntR family transcriptional regulator, histidine utilization repressor
MSEARDTLTLHDRIRQDIEGEVMSGRWAAGQRIPYEHELMAHYACSRMTVNKALATLVERGLIERRKRAGSFVARPRGHSAALEFPDIRTDILDRGAHYEFELLERIEREASPDDRLRLDRAHGRVLAIRCLHLADGEPFAFEDRLIDLEQVPEARSVRFDREPPGSWLLTHVPWSDARHVIASIAADAAAAQALRVAQGRACLLVERWTWRLPEKITHVRQIHPGDRYRLEAHFRP